MRVMTPLLGTKTPIRARRGQVGWGRKSRPVAAFLRVVARHGAAMARHGRHGPSRAAVRATLLSCNTAFRVFTKHETLCAFHESLYASLPTISHHFPRFPGISRPPPPPSADQVSTCPRAVRLSWSAARTAAPRRAARSLLSCALWGGYGAAMARHGRRPSPAPATRPFLFAGRQIFLLERTRPPNHGFHETRDTKRGLYAFHESRNMVFPCPSGDSKESNAKPDQRVFHETRNTRHESRLFSRRLRPSGGEKCRLVPPPPKCGSISAKNPRCAFRATSSVPSHRPRFDLSEAKIMGFHISDYASRFRSSTAPNPRRSSGRPRCRSSEPTRFRGESTG